MFLSDNSHPRSWPCVSSTLICVLLSYQFRETNNFMTKLQSSQGFEVGENGGFFDTTKVFSEEMPRRDNQF